MPELAASPSTSDCVIELPLEMKLTLRPNMIADCDSTDGLILFYLKIALFLFWIWAVSLKTK